jgi:hypothetical protein
MYGRKSLFAQILRCRNIKSNYCSKTILTLVFLEFVEKELTKR